MEYLGWYNPSQDKYEFKKERILYWLKVGAKPTPTVHNLLISAGVREGKKIPVHKKLKVKEGASKETPKEAPKEASKEVPTA